MNAHNNNNDNNKASRRQGPSQINVALAPKRGRTASHYYVSLCIVFAGKYETLLSLVPFSASTFFPFHVNATTFKCGRSTACRKSLFYFSRAQFSIFNLHFFAERFFFFLFPFSFCVNVCVELRTWQWQWQRYRVHL